MVMNIYPVALITTTPFAPTSDAVVDLAATFDGYGVDYLALLVHGEDDPPAADT